MANVLRLDPQKILLVVNASIAQSSVDADDYVQRRGLKTEHRLLYDFGLANGHFGFDQVNGTSVGFNPTVQLDGARPGTEAYVGQSFIDGIANYCNDNDIHAVFLSTYTPTGCVNVGPPLYYPSLAGVAGHATWLQARSSFSVWPPTIGPGINYTLPNMERVVELDWRPISGNPANPNRTRVFGRLGAGLWKDDGHGSTGSSSYTDNPIMEIPLAAGLSGASVYDRAVTQALLAEKQDHKADPHIFSDNLSYSIIGTDRNALAITHATARGFTNIIRAGMDFQFDPGDAPGALYDGSFRADPSSTALRHKLTNERLPIFAMSFARSANYNQTFDGAASDSFTVEPGGWGWVWTSYPYVANQLLHKGASAAIVTPDEPYPDGIPAPADIFYYAERHKLPLCLAYHLCPVAKPNSVVMGDPLYAPYLATGGSASWVMNSPGITMDAGADQATMDGWAVAPVEPVVEESPQQYYGGAGRFSSEDFALVRRVLDYWERIKKRKRPPDAGR